VAGPAKLAVSVEAGNTPPVQLPATFQSAWLPVPLKVMVAIRRDPPVDANY
jgi:hypothetical protein